MFCSGFLHEDLNHCFSSFFQGALNINDRTIPQPPLLQLSVEKLSRDGAYLMDAGSVSCVVVWILKSIFSCCVISENPKYVLGWINVVIAGCLSGDVSVDREELWAGLYQPSPWSSKLWLNTTEYGMCLLCTSIIHTVLPEYNLHEN